jgi:cation-dependent mannose-6-phosphate receptor
MFSNGVILALGAALLLTSSCTADEKKHKVQLDEPCTLHSPNSGAFYDLRPLSLYPLVPGAKPHKEPRTESWQARGYDYPSNFTVNFCAPVIEDLEGREVVGLKHRGDSRNVSAYYESHGRIYSIGFVLNLEISWSRALS